MHWLGDMHDTSSNPPRRPLSAARLGVRWIDHPTPFQRSANVSPVPAPFTRSPTAVHADLDTHDTAKKSLSFVWAGATACSSDQCAATADRGQATHTASVTDPNTANTTIRRSHVTSRPQRTTGGDAPIASHRPPPRRGKTAIPSPVRKTIDPSGAELESSPAVLQPVRDCARPDGPRTRAPTLSERNGHDTLGCEISGYRKQMRSSKRGSMTGSGA